jgi:hypothetical protein
MAKRPVAIAYLHDGGFIVGGKNIPKTVEKLHISGIEMDYDESKRLLTLTYNKIQATIPDANVKCVIYEQEGIKSTVITEHQTPLPPGKIQAQVSTPTSHVFDGPKPL